MRVPFDGNYPLNTDNLFAANPDYYKQFRVKQPDGSIASMRGHNGLDWKIPTGVRILSPIDGKVIESRFDADGYGYYVKIENAEEGVVMAHFKENLVAVGHLVKKGEPVAISNNTGYSTGPHLHLGYYRMPRDRSNGFGGFIDPMPHLENYAPVVKPAVGKMYTQEEYNAAIDQRNTFWQKSDKLREDLEKCQAALNDVSMKYSGFQAIGYETADQVSAMKKGLQEKLLASELQNKSLLDRNAILADVIQKKELEDSKIIDDGIKATKKKEEQDEDLAKIKKAVDLKISADIYSVIERIFKLKDLARKNKPVFDPGPGVPKIEGEKTGDWFPQMLGFSVVIVMVIGSIIVFGGR